MIKRTTSIVESLTLCYKVTKYIEGRWIDMPIEIVFPNGDSRLLASDGDLHIDSLAKRRVVITGSRKDGGVIEQRGFLGRRRRTWLPLLTTVGFDSGARAVSHSIASAQVWHEKREQS